MVFRQQKSTTDCAYSVTLVICSVHVTAQCEVQHAYVRTYVALLFLQIILIQVCIQSKLTKCQSFQVCSCTFCVTGWMCITHVGQHIPLVFSSLLCLLCGLDIAPYTYEYFVCILCTYVRTCIIRIYTVLCRE